MKKNNIFILIIILLLTSGCNNNQTNNQSLKNTDKELQELKELIKNNSNLIKELSDKNKNLEEKITTLEEENKTLNETLVSIQEENKTLKDTVITLNDTDEKINANFNAKYNELQTLINNKNTSGSYTISKSELLGTWNIIGEHGTEVFTNENVEVIGNWIIYNGESPIYYMYRDNKLYLSDNGWIMTK